MFCGRCGFELAAGARFCSACGAQVTSGAPAQDNAGAQGQAPPVAWTTSASQYAQYGRPILGDPLTRLQRPRANRMVAGVCAGLAQQYRWDLTWVRVLTVLISVFSSGAGVVAYVIFWLVMPEEPWMLPAGTAAAPGVIPPSGL